MDSSEALNKQQITNKNPVAFIGQSIPGRGSSWRLHFWAIFIIMFSSSPRQQYVTDKPKVPVTHNRRCNYLASASKAAQAQESTWLFLPKRPALPIRCMYVSQSTGTSRLITRFTFSASIPRDVLRKRAGEKRTGNQICWTDLEINTTRFGVTAHTIALSCYNTP